MKVIYIDLTDLRNGNVSLNISFNGETSTREIPLSQVNQLIEQMETEYYTPEKSSRDYVRIGQTLYNWLDGDKRLLERVLTEARREGPLIVLAITTSQNTANIPWELLHDRDRYFVERNIIPVRWVKTDSNQKALTLENQPKKRALNLLFMASSPRDSRYPSLEFEEEEARILQATERIPLSLTVEESGCLDELRDLLIDKEEGHFDIIHLSGHTSSVTGNGTKEIRFITEDEFGDEVKSRPTDIARALQFRQPPLIFLSGCETGYSGLKGEVQSMAEALLRQPNVSLKAVLGWGRKVLDKDATTASEGFYQGLSEGLKLGEALSFTYQKLTEKKARDWHHLRLYVANTLPGALVPPGRKPVPPYEEIAQDFVGRRRELQNCLRTLKGNHEKTGVLIFGFGGMGKTAIARRLVNRLRNYEEIWFSGVINEQIFINKLKENLDIKERNLLGEQDHINFRLKKIFEGEERSTNRPFLFVFDEFELNLEFLQTGGHKATLEASNILTSLLWAIKKTHSQHRLIITSRFSNFDSDLLQEDFYQEGPLSSFQGSDSQSLKFLRRLKYFDSTNIDEQLIERALEVAKGNPRLLKWLNDEILARSDVNTELTKIEADPEVWRGRVIAEDFCRQVSADSEKNLIEILRRCLLFQIPVPLPALEAVSRPTPNYKKELSRAIGFGLMEGNPKLREGDQVYQVVRTLPGILRIKPPEAPQVYSLYQKAHEKLYELWGNENNKSKENWQEIFRLKFANKDNPERFRQGFSQMLAVQYNSEADRAFESELRKCATDLMKGGLFKQLENYLKQKQWREADEETAWIFYQFMVREKYEDWSELFENFPCKTLAEINRLWLENSNNKFGISIQTKIYQDICQDLGRMEGYVSQISGRLWVTFCVCVGWAQSDRAWTYNHIMSQTTNMTQEDNGTYIEGILPTLIYTRQAMGVRDTQGGYPAVDEGKYTGVVGQLSAWGMCACLFSRWETCNGREWTLSRLSGKVGSIW